MSFSTYVRALRKSWWIVALMLALGIVGGELKNAVATRVYASTITFYVSTPGGDTPSQFADDQFAERRANSYVQLLSSERLAKLVIAKAGLTRSPGAVMSQISASAEINTVLVKAIVTDTSKQRALQIATALSTEFPTMVDHLDNVGLKTPSVALEVVSGPTLNKTPISPRTKVNLGLGLGLGLIIGLLLAAARELLDVTVRAPGTLQEIADAPTLGRIAFDPAVDRAPLIVGRQSHSPRAEAVRQLRTNLQFVDVDNPRQVIVVTSAVAAEGKSLTATNLAIAFSEVEERVLIIECDLRRPRAASYLGIERAVGLSSVLAGQAKLHDVLQSWGNLSVLPSGPTPPNVSSMLSSDRMTQLIRTIRSEFDVVIIDAPPVLPVTDASLISTMSDGVVVVAAHGKVTRHQLTNAISSLEAVGTEVLGFVFNMIPRRQAKEYGGRYDSYRYRQLSSDDAPGTDSKPLDHDALVGETDDVDGDDSAPGASATGSTADIGSRADGS